MVDDSPELVSGLVELESLGVTGFGEEERADEREEAAPGRALETGPAEEPEGPEAPGALDTFDEDGATGGG
jgi:hypothetical protein